MITASHEHTGEKEVRIRRGKVDSLSLYEITDYELDLLEHGVPGSAFLNIAVFLTSAALAFLIALLTTTLPSDRLFAIFVILVVGGFLGAAIFFALWIRSKEDVSSVIARIRQRIPPEELDAKE